MGGRPVSVALDDPGNVARLIAGTEAGIPLGEMAAWWGLTRGALDSQISARPEVAKARGLALRRCNRGLPTTKASVAAAEEALPKARALLGVPVDGMPEGPVSTEGVEPMTPEEFLLLQALAMRVPSSPGHREAQKFFANLYFAADVEERKRNSKQKRAVPSIRDTRARIRKRLGIPIEAE